MSPKICRTTNISAGSQTYLQDHQHIGRTTNRSAGQPTDRHDHQMICRTGPPTDRQDHQHIGRTTNRSAGSSAHGQDMGRIDHQQIGRITHDWQDHRRSAGFLNLGRITQYLHMTTQDDQRVAKGLYDRQRMAHPNICKITTDMLKISNIT